MPSIGRPMPSATSIARSTLLRSSSSTSIKYDAYGPSLLSSTSRISSDKCILSRMTPMGTPISTSNSDSRPTRNSSSRLACGSWPCATISRKRARVSATSSSDSSRSRLPPPRRNIDMVSPRYSWLRPKTMNAWFRLVTLVTWPLAGELAHCSTWKVMPGSRLATSIELLNLLRSDAELPAMIEVAKRDPGMTFQVLQWANSPANGQVTKVTSLNQAFMVLGRNQLYRGLTMSMFRLGGGNRERDESLLEVALTRARFLEMVAQDQLPQAKRDELFLVGLLSLFDVLMGVPMGVILDKMHLSDEIRDVLLKSEGPYASYLMLVLLLERNKVERAMEVADGMGLPIECMGEIGAAAFQWAQDSLHHKANE